MSAILLATKSRTQREREIEQLRELFKNSLLEADVPEQQASQVAVTLATSMFGSMTDLSFQFNSYHAVADIIGQRITTLDAAIAWLNDPSGQRFSCVINLPYSNGEQTAKDLFQCAQSSCLHGLWFNTMHEPGPVLQPDLISLGRMNSCTMGAGLVPMHRQRLVREFARHAAVIMTGETYCQLTAYVAHRHPDPHQVTYLRLVGAGATLNEDASESLPVYVATQIGFGQHWPTHNIQGVSSSHKSGDILIVINPTGSALRGILEGKHSSYPVTWNTGRHPVSFGLAVRVSYQHLVDQQPLATSLGMPSLWLRREPLGIWAHLQGHELQSYHAVGTLGLYIPASIQQWLLSGAPRIYDRRELELPGNRQIALPSILTRYFCSELTIHQFTALLNARNAEDDKELDAAATECRKMKRPKHQPFARLPHPGASSTSTSAPLAPAPLGTTPPPSPRIPSSSYRYASWSTSI